MCVQLSVMLFSDFLNTKKKIAENAEAGLWDKPYCLSGETTTCHIQFLDYAVSQCMV